MLPRKRLLYKTCDAALNAPRAQSVDSSSGQCVIKCLEGTPGLKLQACEAEQNDLRVAV
jgi:hypothetical protein